MPAHVPIVMKALSVAVLICLATQLSHAAPQRYPTAPATARQAGPIVRLAVGANLQAALDSAAPGDVIELPAGATFTGNFVLPQKTGTRYITLRTAPSDTLPNASERVGPEHAGTLARIQSFNGQPALRTAPGAHHWALTLLEFGPNQGGAGDILALGDGSFSQSSLDQIGRAHV